MAVSGNSLGECMNMHGVSFETGRFYVPGPDLCKMCVCDNGHPKGCKSVLCAPPQECKSFQIGNNCCDFICLDNTLGNGSDKTSDFGIWLVATGVTSKWCVNQISLIFDFNFDCFSVTLTLSLLFFILNRFRQRKIRMRVNRQNDEQRGMGSIGWGMVFMFDQCFR